MLQWLGVCVFFRNNAEVRKKLRSFKGIHNGERCFIVGNGPSLLPQDLEKLSGEVTFSCNSIFKMEGTGDWRPYYYFILDPVSVQLYLPILNDIPAKQRFVGVSYFSLKDARRYKKTTDAAFYSLNTPIMGRERRSQRFTQDITHLVDTCGTVAYSMMQFAVYMGFKEIYLIGFDHRFAKTKEESGKIVENSVSNHFKGYDEKFHEKVGGTSVLFPKIKIERGFEQAREYCEAHGVTIRNATRGGCLEVFERTDFDTFIIDRKS